MLQDLETVQQRVRLEEVVSTAITTKKYQEIGRKCEVIKSCLESKIIYLFIYFLIVPYLQLWSQSVFGSMRLCNLNTCREKQLEIYVIPTNNLYYFNVNIEVYIASPVG